MDVPTLLVALGSASVFSFIGQLVQSYVQRRQGEDEGHVDLRKKRIDDAAAFRKELQERDNENNRRIEELRLQADEWQAACHEAKTAKMLAEREVELLTEKVELLENQVAALRAENDRLRGRPPSSPDRPAPPTP